MVQPGSLVLSNFDREAESDVHVARAGTQADRETTKQGELWLVSRTGMRLRREAGRDHEKGRGRRRRNWKRGTRGWTTDQDTEFRADCKIPRTSLRLLKSACVNKFRFQKSESSRVRASAP